MNYLLKGVKLWDESEKNPVVGEKNTTDVTVLNLGGCVAFPAFCDVHVHFREPGFEYKETIESGSLAAARGGYTDVCTMPNLNPCPDSLSTLNIQLKKIDQTAHIKVHPYGTITEGQQGKILSDMEDMAQFVCGFSDDGRGVQSDELMEKAMKKAKSLGKMIVAHCEVNGLLRGGYIHDGEYARIHGHRGICRESEWQQIARDIELVKKTGVSYHVCHISTAESVDIIRKAKAEGVDITCETAPHYLILTDMDIEEDARFKMNPPIRSERDRAALIEGLVDGTIDMIATDHAPHSADEKGRGLEKSLMGVVGLETAFATMYTHLVRKGVITLDKLIEVMAINPRKRFGFEINKNDLTVFDLNCEYEINPDDFKSNGKSSPFTGTKVFGKCMATFCDGKLVWREDT
ncbi:MAG: dihydroorotase [Clostridia bacterium]|nr:dihydroorotase [Clostridia bacterium]